MKQFIELEQLCEIGSDVIAIKLVRTGIIKVGDEELIRTKKVAKQFTIGKMIEILKGTLCRIEYSFDHFNWGVVCDTEDDIEGFIEIKEELVDVLWEAVKYVLGEQS